MSTDRFDQRPDEAYGTCLCGHVVANREEMSAHFTEARGDTGIRHQVHITNPTRGERIEQHLSSLVEDALSGFLEEVWSDIDRDHFTEEEVTKAIRHFGEFSDAWADQ